MKQTINPTTLKKVDRRFSDAALLLESIDVPAAIFNGTIFQPNQSLKDLLSQQILQELPVHEKIAQVIHELAILKSGVSFDLALEDKTYHCLASPLGSGALIFFEDISTTFQSEKENALLYRLTLLFTENQRPVRELLQMAVDQILFELTIFDCSILLFDKKTGLLHSVAWGTTNLTSSMDGKQSFELGQGIAGQVALQRKPLVVPNILKDPRFFRRSTDTDALALLTVPLLHESELVGVMSLTRLPGRTFSDKEVQFFVTLASRLSLAIQADRLKRREQRQYELVREMDILPNLAVDYGKLLPYIADILEANCCALFEYTENRELVMSDGTCSLPINQKQLEYLRKLISGPARKNPWILPKRPICSLEHAAKGVIFPLMARDQLLGLLYITNTTWNRHFTDADLALGSGIVSQVATAVGSAQFYEAVMEERNMMQQVLDSLKDGLVLYRPDMEVAMINQETRRLLGMKKDITGLSWNEALHEGARRYSAHRLVRHFDAYRFFEEAIQHGKTSTGLATLTSNPPRTLQIATGPVYDRRGEISGVLSHSWDITLMHKLQQQLSNQVKQLTSLFRISSVTGTDVNSLSRRILSYLPQLVPVNSGELFLGDKHGGKLQSYGVIGEKKLLKSLNPSIEEKIRLTIQKGKPQAYTVTDSQKQKHQLLVIPVDGQERCIGVLVVIDKSDNASFTKDDINLLGVAINRLAVKVENIWLLAEVEESRKRLEAIIDQSVDGILVTDPDQRIEIWNKALERLTGVSEKEACGQLATELRSTFGDYQEFRHDDILEIRYIHKMTGKVMWLGVAWSSIYSGDTITGHVAILRDISRQKELEAAKNEFVATASHELRSPLTAIVGYLSMLKRGDAGQIINSQQAFFVDKAYQNAKRMVSLVEDILMTTRMDAGQIRYRKERLDIVPVIESVLSDIRFKAEEKQISTSFDKDGVSSVYADQDGVHQVLTNLINNAVKYTPSGGRIRVHFEKATEEGSPVLVTAITDTGVGIETNDYTKIFEKFGRVDNPLSVAAGGTGLGLYITKTIVEDLGGKIWVKSTKGEGSTFYFSLPVAEKPGRERKQ